MARILLTGMSASQASPSANERTLTFAGVLNRTLTGAGHTVTWVDPDIRWTAATLSLYDVVLVGVAPITSLGANRTYGALSIIDRLWGISKLELFIDAPRPAQITTSLRSMISNPDNLTKDFYGYRKDFLMARQDESRLLAVIERLYTDEWPTTIYPSLPWKLAGDFINKMPSGLERRLTGINLDQVLFDDTASQRPDFDSQTWASDDISSSWTKRVSKNLDKKVVPLRPLRGITDEQVLETMTQSVGVLLAPRTRAEGLWWSYRVIQALGNGTPIVTDKSEVINFGTGAWSTHPMVLELEPNLRRQTAEDQLDDYLAATPTIIQAHTNLESLLGLQ